MSMENNNTSTVTRIAANNNSIIGDESSKEEVSHTISAAQLTLPKLPPIKAAPPTKNSCQPSVHNWFQTIYLCYKIFYLQCYN